MKADTRLTSVARIGEKRKMEVGGKGWEGRDGRGEDMKEPGTERKGSLGMEGLSEGIEG